jgi:hypothetical protein
MPALGLAAPGVALDAINQARRSDHARRACATLDEAWALLARLQHPADSDDAGDAALEASGDEVARLLDEAERLAANLESDLAERRATAPHSQPTETPVTEAQP